MQIDFSKYDNSWYDSGRGVLVRTLWHFVNALFLQSAFFPSSRLKVLLLRLFGAQIGKNVVLKPSINVKYPWNLEIGDNSWVGEKAWLDSLAPIKIGKNVCVSQGAYFCTGSHNWSDPAFGLIVKPITVEDGAWVAAKSVVLQGVTVGSHSVLGAGAVVSSDTEPFMVYAGNPAVKIKERKIQ